MGDAYRELMRRPELESDAQMERQLQVLHTLYLLRPPGTELHASVMDQLVGELRQALDHQRLGPVATRYGLDLLATLELEHDLWQGQPVTTAMLDTIQTQQQQGDLLGRFAARLGDPKLRSEAQRRSAFAQSARSPQGQPMEGKVAATALEPRPAPGTTAAATAAPPAPAPPSVSQETRNRIKTQLERGVAAQQKLLGACYRTYGDEEGKVTARVTIDATGSVVDAELAGVGSSLAVCVERVLKLLTVAPFSGETAKMELQISFASGP